MACLAEMTMARRESPLERNPLFGKLPLELSENLRVLNPWWTNQPGPAIPSFRRWPFHRLLKLVPAAVLRGPRRVGKTVLLRQLIESLLAAQVVPNRMLYVPFDELPALRNIDEPVLAISRWFEKEILRASFNEMGRKQEPAYLFFDEVQNLDAWAPQVKNLVDNHTVRVLVTGSSSLRIEAGRDSLAGRITTLDLGPLLLREIAELRFGVASTPYWKDNGMESIASAAFWKDAVAHALREASARDQAFEAFSGRGSYPIARSTTIFPGLNWQTISMKR
jgi:predicted AAA+ superfamily ATPase